MITLSLSTNSNIGCAETAQRMTIKFTSNSMQRHST